MASRCRACQLTRFARRPRAAQSTPLAHEAAEFLTDEGPAAFWAFVDAWRGARWRD